MLVLQKDERLAVQDKQRNLVVIEEDENIVSVYYNDHVYLVEGDAIGATLLLSGLIDVENLDYYSDTAKVSAPDPVDIGFSVVGLIDVSTDRGQLRAISDVPEVQKRIINFFSHFCWQGESARKSYND